MTDRILPEVHQLNDLLKKIQAYKQSHPETKVGYYPEDYGSLLNAYREGDLTFDECIAHLEALAERARVEGRDEGLDAVLDVVSAYSARLVDTPAQHEAYEAAGIACHSISEGVRGLKSSGGG